MLLFIQCYFFSPTTFQQTNTKAEYELQFSSTNTDIVMLIVKLYRDLLQSSFSLNKDLFQVGITQPECISQDSPGKLKK